MQNKSSLPPNANSEPVNPKSDIPQYIKRCLVQCIRDIPNKELEATGPLILDGGFRKAAFIRQRLIARVEAGSDTDKVLEKLFRGCLPCRDVVATLSCSALCDLAAWLTVLLRREPFIAALWYDQRPEVKELAKQQLTTRAIDPAKLDYDAVRDMYRAYLQQRVFVPLGWTVVADGERDDVRRKEIALAEAHRGALRNVVEDREATITQKNETIQALNERLNAEKAKAMAAVDELKTAHVKAMEAATSHAERLAREKEGLQQAIADLKKGMDVAIEKGIVEGTAAATMKWLDGPQQVDKCLETTTARLDDLLTQAEAALNAQAQADKYSGNRAELAKRIISLEAARVRLLDAEHNAIHPVKQVTEVRRHCDAGIARIKTVLRVQQSPDKRVEELMANINRCSDWSQLRDYSDLVERITEEQLISQEEAQQVHGRIQASFSRLQSAQAEHARTRGDNGWSLRGSIHRNEKTRLILDGHNVLYLLKEVFEPHYELGHPGEKARKRLQDIILKLVVSKSNVHATICYDSDTANTYQPAANVTIVFSGGEGSDRADKRIEEYLQACATDPDTTVFVVTDDRQVRTCTKQAGALFVPVSLFAVLLADFKCLA